MASSSLPTTTPPVYDGESFSLPWLQSLLPFTVRSVTHTPLVGEGGMMCSLQRIRVEKEDGTFATFVFKQISDERRCQVSRTLGLTREALFYLSPLSQAFDGHLARCYYSHADPATGAKYILLEDLHDATHAGFLFGRGNPNNWAKSDDDLAAIAAAFYPPGATLKNYIEATFLAMSRVHAAYWCKEELLDHAWLRGSDWWGQKGAEGWNAIQDALPKTWDAVKKRISESEDVKAMWPADLVEIIDASVRKISWDAYVTLTRSRKWTLVTGDCHPANFMWYPNKDVRVVDFEMVGVGSGPQDLAQFFVSHSTAEDRRACEMDVLRSYHADLIARGVTNYEWEECLRDYREGGSERWLWFLIWFAGNATFPAAVQTFFIQQTVSFCRDHGVTPENVGQPRP